MATDSASPTFDELRSSFVGSSSSAIESVAAEKFFRQIVDLGIDFKTQSQVKRATLPTPSTKTFGSIPEKGISYSQLLNCWKQISETSSNWTSPNFMGFPDSGNSVPGLGAALLIPMLNQNLANQDICAPSASFIEMEVVHWLRHQLGFPVPELYSNAQEIGGVLTLGGCLSNTISLMAARESLFTGSGATGLPVEPSLVRVLVPDIIEHYSVRSAMAWLSLGELNVVRVPVDDEFRMKLDALERCIEEERAKGYYILACVAYAGDSRSMRVDNLEAIGACLRKANIWFHVDACHGSQLAFSQTHRHKLRGIEEADSVTIDPHKVLWIPNTCSFVLFKDPRSLANISTNSDLILKTQWSLGQITPCIGSKAFDALKIWSVIKYFGRSGIEKLIDGRLELTKQMQQEITKRPELILLNQTDINSCIFLYLPHGCLGSPLSTTDLVKINECNRFIKTSINVGGDAYLHGFELKSCPHPLLPAKTPIYVLRTMNGNPLTDIENVHALLNRVESLGRQFLQEKGYRILKEKVQLELLPVHRKLQAALLQIFEGAPHCALVYGSSVSRANSILSDIDLMIFAPDEFCTAERRKSLEDSIVNIYMEESIALDAEIPYWKKLLIPLSFAQEAARVVPFHQGTIPMIAKTTEYLESDEMLSRLVLNVLTVPTLLTSGDVDLIGFARYSCEITLVDVIGKAESRPIGDAEHFAAAAIGGGVRSGEEYLGYKPRPEIRAYLVEVFERHGRRLGSSTSGSIESESSSQLMESVEGVDVSPDTSISTKQSSVPEHADAASASMEHEKHSSSNADVKSSERRSLFQEQPEFPGPRSACVLFLNGFPGVGKYAIARVLKSVWVGSRLIDNHLLIDPVEAIIPGRGPAHHTLRRQFRRVAFDALKQETNLDSAIIMTSCAADTPQDREVFAEHVEIARVRKIPFIAVNIICDEETNAKRLRSRERVDESGIGKTKLVDTKALSSLRKDYKLLNRANMTREAEDVEFYHLDLDTSDLSVQAASVSIASFLRDEVFC